MLSFGPTLYILAEVVNVDRCNVMKAAHVGVHKFGVALPDDQHLNILRHVSPNCTACTDRVTAPSPCSRYGPAFEVRAAFNDQRYDRTWHK